MRRWVRVTQGLSILSRFDGVKPRLLIQAMEEGRQTHKACLGWVKGLYFPVPKEIEASVEGFKLWYGNAIEEVLCVEEELKDKTLGLVGHVDLIARIKGEELFSVIDLKRSTVDWICGLQLGAYEYMAEKKYRRKFGPRYALRIGKDGKTRMVPFNDPNDWPVFLGIYSAYNHSRKKEKT